MSDRSRNTPRLLLACAGLHARKRGYETSTLRLFQALRNHDTVACELFPKNRAEACRRSGLNLFVLLLRRLGEKSLGGKSLFWRCYSAEQFVFALDVFFRTRFLGTCDIVWTKDSVTARVLTALRDFFQLKKTIVWADGTGLQPLPCYNRFDLIQELHPHNLEAAVAAGVDRRRLALVTNCVALPPPSAARDALRQRFQYHPDEYVIVSVASWSASHKRLDHLLREVAALQNPQVRLLLCGQPEPETPALQALADRLLPGRVQWHTLDEQGISDALALADVFVLASLFEGLGNAPIEAALSGLPVLCHPLPSLTWALGEDCWFVDMGKPGALASALAFRQKHGFDTEALSRLKKRCQQLFDPETVAHSLESAILECHRRRLEASAEATVV